METFKFVLLSIIVIAIIGLIGYWAVATIEPGDTHAYKQREEELREENKELLEEIADLKSELAELQAEKEPEEPAATTPNPAQPAKPVVTTTASKHQTLINELQKLVDDNILMKVGSRGTRVGTVQTFLNIYNNSSKRVDNDYGAGMKTDVMNFQKAVGLTSDGETGPATYRKMIEWLKKQ